MLKNESKQEVDLEKLEILLWGVTGSGKTTLWKSFLHQVNLIRIALKQKNSEINLMITDDKGTPLSGEEVEFEATLRLNYDLIVFQRTSSVQEGLRRSVNIHAHWIGVFDHMGQNTVDAVSNPSSTNDAALIRRNLQQKAKCVLIVLNRGNGTVDDFYENFKNLVVLLMDREPCYIAMCITKIDMLGDGVENLEPDDLVISHFGPDVGNKILEQINAMKGLHKIHFSAVSATGTYIENGKRKANFDGSNRISSPANWKPENVEQPFFWLFEQVESDRLKYTNKGLFYKLIPCSDVAKARIEERVSYRDLLRSIKW